MKIHGKIFACAALVLGIFALPSFALETDDEVIKNKKIFGIEFPDKSSFYAQAALVASVSKNEYIVSKTLFVTEVTISILSSPNNVRIYHAMPMNSEQFEAMLKKRLPQNAVERMTAAFSGVSAVKETPILKEHGADIKRIFTLSTVHKDYPMTTHAKNLEFVVMDLDELLDFYDRISMDFTGSSERTKSAKPQNDTSKSASDDKINPTMNGRLYIIQDTREDKDEK